MSDFGYTSSTWLLTFVFVDNNKDNYLLYNYVSLICFALLVFYDYSGIATVITQNQHPL